MAEKNNGKVDPAAIRNLISQGIQMKPREEVLPVPKESKEDELEVSDDVEEQEEARRSTSRTRRRLPKGDYESLFSTATI